MKPTDTALRKPASTARQTASAKSFIPSGINSAVASSCLPTTPTSETLPIGRSRELWPNRRTAFFRKFSSFQPSARMISPYRSTDSSDATNRIDRFSFEVVSRLMVAARESASPLCGAVRRVHGGLLWLMDAAPDRGALAGGRLGALGMGRLDSRAGLARRHVRLQRTELAARARRR